MAHGPDFAGKEGQTLPDLSNDFRSQVSTRYIELFETVSGKSFEPDSHEDPIARIQHALKAYKL